MWVPLEDSKLLAGSWDLVPTYKWAYKLAYNPPKWPKRRYPNYE